MIEPDENFRNWNLYRRLVRRGLVKPVQCSCGTEPVAEFGENDALMFHCYTCDTVTTPGEGIMEQIRAVVKEHFSD